jgi:hypothetical protein
MLLVLSDTQYAEIKGSAEDLRRLGLTIKACETLCQIPLLAPAPCDGRGLIYLTGMVIKVDSTPLNVWVEGLQIFFSGAREKLELFVSNIEALLDLRRHDPAQNSDHLHIEFYPGHFFLSKEALPLILIQQD